MRFWSWFDVQRRVFLEWGVRDCFAENRSLSRSCFRSCRAVLAVRLDRGGRLSAKEDEAELLIQTPFSLELFSPEKAPAVNSFALLGIVTLSFENHVNSGLQFCSPGHRSAWRTVFLAISLLPEVAQVVPVKWVRRRKESQNRGFEVRINSCSGCAGRCYRVQRPVQIGKEVVFVEQGHGDVRAGSVQNRKVFLQHNAI
uniref:(northern house mosquito) hypothetical protein n=1 Tax=Culex pipiens TaxID=7175 RepID=A0A8D8EXA2_CULPI